MNPLAKKLIITTATLAALAVTPLARAADSERHEQKNFPASSGGTLTFEAMAGAIDLKTHDEDEVTYDVVLKPGDARSRQSSELLDLVEFDYQASNGDVKITVKWKDDKQPRNSNLNARHTLVVPSRYNVDVRTAGGGISAEEVNGRVAARTSGGSIRFGNVNGPIKAHTSGGSITLEDVKGDAEVETSGGGIKVGNVDGNVLANTSGGSIQVGTVTGEMKGETSGGSIEAELDGQIEKPLELRTSGGNISLSIPADFKATLNARTSGGKVNCELPVQGTVKRDAINGELNGGGPTVALSTSGGSIKVAKR
jgi:DUF4097 and DUF4098 domain-containing protein YvlB